MTQRKRSGPSRLITGRTKQRAPKDIKYPWMEITASLKMEEGFRSHVYQDSESIWTLGYGRNVHPGSGLGLSHQEAGYLLAADIQRSIDECERAFPFMENLSQNQLSALIQLCFQLGLPRLRKFRRMLRHLEDGEYTQASEELLNSKYAREQCPERARRMARLIRD